MSRGPFIYRSPSKILVAGEQWEGVVTLVDYEPATPRPPHVSERTWLSLVGMVQREALDALLRHDARCRRKLKGQAA